MIVVTGQVCLCYIPDQMTLPVYLGTSCCVLAILLPTGDSLFTSFCSPGILLPKWQLLTKHHNTIFTYSLHFLTNRVTKKVTWWQVILIKTFINFKTLPEILY